MNKTPTTTDTADTTARKNFWLKLSYMAFASAA